MNEKKVNCIAGGSTAFPILLVEDNPVNQLLARRVLSAWGLVVTIANDGREALDLIHKKGFVLVLMDIQMPEMDGLEATRRIRSMNGQYFKTVPILALTACSREGTEDIVKQCGMNDILTKPFDAQEMQKKINHYINGFVF